MYGAWYLAGMSGVDALRQALAGDPVLAYASLAAALLATVSLVTGWLRLDFVVLFRPRVLLRVTGAVVIAFVLDLATARFVAAGAPGGLGDLGDLFGTLYRLPLYLIALAYGPSVGLFGGALYAAFQASGPMPGWNEAILALELIVLGWLAIYPSPRSRRWAGPFDAVLAYALAWGTGGLSLLQAQTGAVTLSGVWQQHAATAAGVLVVAVALAAFGPGVYRRWFPMSRVAPPVTAIDPPADAAPEAALLSLEMGEHADRPDVELTIPDLPRDLRRRRGRRHLEPLPFHPEQEPLR